MQQEPAAQARLAHLSQGRGDPARAEALYRAVLGRAPHNAVALVNLGVILGSRGRLAEAIELWRRALAANPCLEEAAQNLITALRAQKNDTAAAVVQQARSFCDFAGQ